jgi:hypothetical protein
MVFWKQEVVTHPEPIPVRLEQGFFQILEVQVEEVGFP